MIVHLIGGRSCGEVIDTEGPGAWAGTELESLPLPAVLEVHSARANRTAYRMRRATSTEVWYQIDPELTAAYRAR